MATSYASPQAAVDAVRPGYTIVGATPNIEEVPNEKFNKNEPENAQLNPRTVKRPNGTTLSLQGPDGKPDRMVISDVKVVASGTQGGGKGGVGYEILEGPTQTPTATSTPVTGWDRLDASGNVITDPTKPAVYIRDPKAPPGSVPFKLDDAQLTGDPKTWTPITDPNDKSENPRTIGLYDPKSQKVAASVPVTAGAQPSGTFDNVTDPNDPEHKRVIAIVDRGDKSIHTVSTIDGKQIVTTTNAVYVVDKDTGTSTKVQDLDPNQPAQVFTIGNQAFVFDPKTKTITKGPSVDEPATVGISTQNEFYVFFDKQGKEVGRVKNPSYRPPSPTIPAANTVAPNIQIEDPDHPGQLKWVPNQGQLTIGEATQNLIKDLTGQTVDPAHPMTLEEAQSVLTAAIGKMNAESQQAQTAAGAAQNILSTQQQGAQTGAGMLQARATNAQNLIQQGLGVVTSAGGRYGNYSGGLLSPMPGFGANLVQGAQSFATELGGGQAVFDTAVRMVQAADPNNQNPDRAAAVATLTQLMDRYRQHTGQDYPTVAATKALQSSQQNGGMQPPVTIAPLDVTRAGGPSATQLSNLSSGGLGTVMGTPGVGGPNAFVAPPAVAAGTPPPLATNNLGNLDPRLRGAIY